MTQPEGAPITYQSTGVNYDAMDPFKRQAQILASGTAHHLERHGFSEVPESRGESAYVWDRGHEYMSKVIEGLGTKNLVADALLTARAVERANGRSYYDVVAQDTFAMIVNDLVTVGGVPEVVDQYVAVGESEWFDNARRASEFLEGWRHACDIARITWGGGETPTLRDIIVPGTADLAGSAVGSIRPKDRLILGKDLKPGDVLIGVKSSGIHANGLTTARRVADRLPDGYETPLSDGLAYGEAILTPTTIYSPLVEGLQEQGVKINYISNITGHGWRKIMRSTKALSYRINNIPVPQPEFDLIQKTAGVDVREMYGNYNMGVGYVLFVNGESADRTMDITEQLGFSCMALGKVEEGPKQVVIEPLSLVFASDTLGVR